MMDLSKVTPCRCDEVLDQLHILQFWWYACYSSKKESSMKTCTFEQEGYPKMDVGITLNVWTAQKQSTHKNYVMQYATDFLSWL